MKLRLIALFVFASFVALANDSVKVTVLDENNEPLTGVKIVEVENNSTTYTDFDGVSEVTTDSKATTYKIDHIGYKSSYISVSQNSESHIEVVMKKKELHRVAL